MPWYIHLLFWYSCWWSPLTICKIGFDMFTLYFKCTSGFQGGFMRLLKEIGFIIFCTTGYNLRCGLCEFLMMISVEGINAVLWCNIWDRFSRLLNGLRTPEMNSNQSGRVGGYILVKNHEKPTWNHEKPWKTMENHEKPWKTMKNHEKPWKTMNNHEKPTWNHEKPWKTMKNHKKSTWNQENHEKPWKINLEP